MALPQAHVETMGGPAQMKGSAVDPRLERPRAPGIGAPNGLPTINPRLAPTRGVARRGGLNSQVLHRPTYDVRGEPQSIRDFKAPPQMQQLENPRAVGSLMDSFEIRDLRSPRVNDYRQI